MAELARTASAPSSMARHASEGVRRDVALMTAAVSHDARCMSRFVRNGLSARDTFIVELAHDAYTTLEAIKKRELCADRDLMLRAMQRQPAEVIKMADGGLFRERSFMCAAIWHAADDATAFKQALHIGSKFWADDDEVLLEAFAGTARPSPGPPPTSLLSAH